MNCKLTKSFVIILFLLLSGFISITQAKEDLLEITPTKNLQTPKNDYFREHIIGWHWYNEKLPSKIKAKKEKKDAAKPIELNELDKSHADPSAQMALIRKTIERALNKAILEPSVENIHSYIVLQNKISDQSTKFANFWQKTLLEYPELNYSLSHPTNMAAKQVYLDSYQEREIMAISNFFKNKGMFFFYSSTCPYCRKFAPLVKVFSLKYKIVIIPITVDGISLPEFPNSRMDSGQAKKFKISSYPALFAVNPYNDKAIPISYGFVSENDLRQRILDISTGFKNDL